MENATKALLIAAAVMIAVLLITLVMGVLNKGSEQVGNMDLSEYEIQQFNAKFNGYVEKNTNGSEINAMLKTVFYHNNEQEDASTRVEVVDEATTDKKAAIATNQVGTGAVPTVPTGAKYDVHAIYTDSLIKKLVITKPGIAPTTTK